MELNEKESFINLNTSNNKVKEEEKYSIFIAVITWLKMVLGLGIFTLPYFYSIFGLSLGIIISLFSCIITYFSIQIIFNISEITKINNYPSLIEKYIGYKTKIIYTISTIIDISSSFMIYIIISWRIFYILCIKYNIIYFRMKGKYIDEYFYENYIIRIIFISIISLLWFPLLLFRNLEKLKYVSSLYIIVMIFWLSIIFLQTPKFYENNKDKKGFNIELTYQPYSFSMVTGFFSIILSFFNQPFIFEIKNDLKNNSLDRITKVSRISHIILVVFFILVGTLGYISWGDKFMNEIIILRQPYSNFNKDILMNIGLIFFLISNIFSIPTFNPSCRNLLSESFQIDINKNKKNYFLISIIPYLLCAFISIVYPDIVTIFGYIGATISNFNGFFIIFLLDIMIIGKKYGKYRNFFMKSSLVISVLLFLFYVIMVFFN